MDMVSLNIAGGILASICRDMGVTLMRTSYSTIFSESLDFTCALALPSGEMIATGDFCPAMIGGMPLLIRSCVNEIAVEDLEEGDITILTAAACTPLSTPSSSRFSSTAT
jgi:N-methylhydantoinase B